MSDMNAQIVGNFLVSDVGVDINSWVELFDDYEHDQLIGNLTKIGKRQDLVALSYILFDEGPYLIFKRQQMIELLEAWNRVLIMRPHFVEILIDNNCIEIIHKDTVTIDQELVSLQMGLDGYYIKECSHFVAHMFGKFFQQEVCERAHEWIAWLEHAEQESQKGICAVRVTKKDEVVLFQEKVSQDGPHYSFKISSLINALKTWDELYKKGYPSIIITIDGEYVALQGK
jgi:hypothetical protein